jgi:hypothetical protein
MQAAIRNISLSEFDFEQKVTYLQGEYFQNQQTNSDS